MPLKPCALPHATAPDYTFKVAYDEALVMLKSEGQAI
jgi:hypothetical protein